MLDYHKTGNGLVISGRFNDLNSMNAVKIVTRNKVADMNMPKEHRENFEVAVSDTMKLIRDNFTSLKEDPKFTMKMQENENDIHVELYTNMDSMNETDLSSFHFIEKTMDSFDVDFDKSSKMFISMKKNK
ncbi:MAG: hypothetical protein MJ246_01460 [Clostridia bacterium]|nr:hypothetical protein [Clostridia bacterium]